MRKLSGLLPPSFRRLARRVLRVLWWTATLQLPRRFAEWTASRAEPSSTALILTDQRSGPVALVVDDRWPEPDRDSGSIDTANLVASLITFGYHTIIAKCTHIKQDPQYIQLLRELGAKPHQPEGAAALQAFIERHAEEICLFVLTRVGAGGQYLELIRSKAPHARIIFNTVDLHFLRESRAARLSGDAKALKQAELTRDREEFLTARSDLTIVVSETERDVLCNSVPAAQVLHLPLARPVRRRSISFEQRAGIGFVGGFAHQPNADAMHYFLSDIWPQVNAAIPGVHFVIVGTGLPTKLLYNVPGDVRYIGHVDDLDSWLDGLRLTVAPLRIGAGAKGKVASSLAASVPCVASAVAAEGMGLTPEQNILIGESAVEFAAQVVRLHNDRELWMRLSTGSWRFAEEMLSIKGFRSRLRRSIIELRLPAFAEDGRYAEYDEIIYRLMRRSAARLPSQN